MYISTYTYMYMYMCCLTLLASFFLPSHISLKYVHTCIYMYIHVYTCIYMYM